MYNPQLETFLCVAESGSFNKAAERMYISPPAVIKQINLLESSLDLQLFIRKLPHARNDPAGGDRQVPLADIESVFIAQQFDEF